MSLFAELFAVSNFQVRYGEATDSRKCVLDAPLAFQPFRRTFRSRFIIHVRVSGCLQNGETLATLAGVYRVMLSLFLPPGPAFGCSEVRARTEGPVSLPRPPPPKINVDMILTEAIVTTRRRGRYNPYLSHCYLQISMHQAGNMFNGGRPHDTTECSLRSQALLLQTTATSHCFHRTLWLHVACLVGGPVQGGWSVFEKKQKIGTKSKNPATATRAS